jgi:hypothetical protein
VEGHDATDETIVRTVKCIEIRSRQNHETLGRAPVLERPLDESMADLCGAKADLEVGTSDDVESWLTDPRGAAPRAFRFITPDALLVSYGSNGPAWY